jgi:hypothetical protein
MKKVKPHENETYFVGTDDNCLVVQSGNKKSPKVWLSKSMVKWIASNAIKNVRRIINDIESEYSDEFTECLEKLKQKLRKL